MDTVSSTRSEVSSAIRAIAAQLDTNARTLRELAAAYDAETEEQWIAEMGSRFSAGNVAQLHHRVVDLTHVREMWHFDRALTGAVIHAQRAGEE